MTEAQPLSRSGVTLVIGGSSGIGLATGRWIVERGGPVCLAARQDRRRREAAGNLGPLASEAFVDLDDPATWQPLIAHCADLQHIVFLPPPGGLGSVGTLAVDQVQAHLTRSLLAAHALIQAALPRLGAASGIVLVTGALSRRPQPGTAGVVASQWALEGWARAAAGEIAPVRINTVVPGVVDTPFWDDAAAAGAKDGFFEQSRKATPLGRISQPEEIAAVVGTALTNPFMTGASLVVDGGWSL